jgi:hypothetical protein
MTIFTDARARSLDILDSLDYQVSTSLPLLSGAEIQRGCKAIVARLLSLYGVVALSYDWEQRQIPVMAWLKSEKLIGDLTEVELEFVTGDAESSPQMQWRLEALFALAWATEITSLSILDPVPDDFVHLFPSIGKSAPTLEFRDRARAKCADDIVMALDLLYCLSSAQTDLYLRGEIDPGKNGSCPNLYAVQQRRQALEWLLSDVPWEDIELDT